MKKQYASIDLMKLFMAISIMLAHISSEVVQVPILFKTLTSIYNFGVPFFFACSGYFFFEKVKQDKKNGKSIYINFSKRILKMYAVWSGIYFCFVLTKWIQTSANITTIVAYFHKALVFTTYSTIWFLPSLWVGISITLLLLKYLNSISKVIIFAIGFYLIGSLGYSYLPLCEKTILIEIYDAYKSIFYTLRNGIFAGFPFVAIGALISNRGVKGGIKKNFSYMMIFCILFIMEAMYIKTIMHTNVDMGIMLFPAIYFMILWLLQLNLPYNSFWIHCRNLSMLIFLGQRLFITAIPSVIPSSYINAFTQNWIFGLSVFAFTTISFSLVIMRYSKKYNWLKILW